MVLGIPELILNVLWLLHFSSVKGISSVSVSALGLLATALCETPRPSPYLALLMAIWQDSISVCYTGR